MRLIKSIVSKNEQQSDLIAKVETYRLLDRKVKRLSNELSRIKEEILLEMGDAMEVITPNGDVIARKIHIRGRESFNKVQFNVDYPGIYSQYISIGKESIRFVLC